MTSCAGTQPHKQIQAPGKSSDQNWSPYRVFRPNWRDYKAIDIKQHCALACAGKN